VHLFQPQPIPNEKHSVVSSRTQIDDAFITHADGVIYYDFDTWVCEDVDESVVNSQSTFSQSATSLSSVKPQRELEESVDEEMAPVPPADMI
jgi:hypothetical protein